MARWVVISLKPGDVLLLLVDSWATSHCQTFTLPFVQSSFTWLLKLVQLLSPRVASPLPGVNSRFSAGIQSWQLQVSTLEDKAPLQNLSSSGLHCLHSPKPGFVFYLASQLLLAGILICHQLHSPTEAETYFSIFFLSRFRYLMYCVFYLFSLSFFLQQNVTSRRYGDFAFFFPPKAAPSVLKIHGENENMYSWLLHW